MRAISILEDALTLLVDDLPALGEREILRVAAARVRLGAHEAIFLRLAADVLLDDAGRLELAAGRIGRGADAEALVFHGLARRRVLGRGLPAAAEEPSEKSLQKAHWLISPQLPRSTKLSSTILRPALSKSTVSLLPSTAATVPGPNLRWKTRSPVPKAEAVPVDLATSSPSIISGPPRRAPAPRPDAKLPD